MVNVFRKIYISFCLFSVCAVSVYAETPVTRQPVHECHSLMISLGRFANIPTSALKRTEEYRGDIETEAILARLDHILSLSRKLEFARNWIQYYFQDLPKHGVDVFRNALAAHGRRIQIEQALHMLELLLENKGQNPFQSLARENPDALKMIGDLRTWSEFWNLYIYSGPGRRLLLPLVSAKDLQSLGAVLDSNVLISMASRPKDFRSVQLRSSGRLQYVLMPEQMIEVPEVDQIIEKINSSSRDSDNAFRLNEYHFNLNEEQWADYYELVDNIQGLRRAYETQNDILSSQRDVTSDDNLLAQTAIAKGVGVFVTDDQKLFNAMAVHGSQYSSKVGTTFFSGRHYLSVEYSFESSRGHKYSVIVINFAREVPETINLSGQAPDFSRDRERLLSRRDVVLQPEKRNLDLIDDFEFHSLIIDNEASVRSLLTEKIAIQASRESDDVDYLILPADFKLKNSHFQNYDLSSEQRDYISIHRQMGGPEGYLYSQGSEFADMSLQAAMRFEDLMLVENMSGEKFSIFKLKRRAKDIRESVDEEDLLKSFVSFENAIRHIYESSSFSEEELSVLETSLASFDKALLIDRVKVLSLMKEVFDLPERNTLLSLIPHAVRGGNQQIVLRHMSRFYDLVEDRKEDSIIKLQLVGGKTYDFDTSISESFSKAELIEIFSKIQFHPAAVEEFERVSVNGNIEGILSQLRIVSTGVRESNVALRPEGYWVRSIAKTYLIAFDSKPNHKPTVLAFTSYSDMESRAFQESIAGRKE